MVNRGAWGMYLSHSVYKCKEVICLSILDVNCRESMSIPKKGCNACVCMETLLLGSDYESYLWFDLPPYQTLKNLQAAKLVLFKVPSILITREEAERVSSYELYPLLDYFSEYSGFYDRPPVDLARKVEFIDRRDYSYTEADITSIVTAWLNMEVENKGMVLMGNENVRLISYASEGYARRGMRPMLRLVYEDVVCPPLSCVPCRTKMDEGTENSF